MSDNNTSNQTDTVCSIGGRLYYYDVSGDSRGDVMSKSFTYIGRGRIYSVNGKLYCNEETFHFWRYNDRTLLEVR